MSLLVTVVNVYMEVILDYNCGVLIECNPKIWYGCHFWCFCILVHFENYWTIIVRKAINATKFLRWRNVAIILKVVGSWDRNGTLGRLERSTMSMIINLGLGLWIELKFWNLGGGLWILWHFDKVLNGSKFAVESMDRAWKPDIYTYAEIYKEVSIFQFCFEFVLRR